jgi:hypothetical protein
MSSWGPMGAGVEAVNFDLDGVLVDSEGYMGRRSPPGGRARRASMAAGGE